MKLGLIGEKIKATLITSKVESLEAKIIQIVLK